MLNLTQHALTAEQWRDGAVEPEADVKTQIQELITFDRSVMEHPEQIWNRAKALVSLIKREYPLVNQAVVGGALYFMPALVRELKEAGIQPYFSYTDRVSQETHNPDGSVTKTLVFKHLGWVEA